MNYLPWWMQWAQAIALIVISCVGSCIAFRQARIAAAKLNLDLYDRRYKVFDTARQFANVGLWSAEITHEAISAYHAGTIDAVFLFDEEMEKYLDAFGKKYFIFGCSKRIRRSHDTRVTCPDQQ